MSKGNTNGNCKRQDGCDGIMTGFRQALKAAQTLFPLVCPKSFDGVDRGGAARGEIAGEHRGGD
jgi:hypothetical protein